jgi:hypothetical protein
MSQLNQRLVYRNAVKSMINAGVDPRQAILSQSYLRLERNLSSSITNYQFGVTVNDAPAGTSIKATENRLNLQDSFFVGSISMFTTLSGSNGTNTNLILDSYPNKTKYSSSGASDALYNLYNGYFSLTVNNRVITPSWNAYQHLYVPQTQNATGATPATGATLPVDQFEGSTSASIAVEPNWVLIGSKNNNFTLNLPSAVSALQASQTTTVVVILRGVLAQNSTIIS